MRRTVWKPRMVLATALILSACGNGSPASPSPGPTELNVQGTWDASFNGTIVQRNDGGAVGDSQRDDFVLALQQAGTSITGELIYDQGRPDELRAPLTGTLTGTVFDYQVEGSFGGCALTIRAETTLNDSATMFTGSQTQATCEGRADGQVSATRR